MTKHRFFSLSLVAGQFLVLGALFATGPLLARSVPFLVLECAGVAMGIWAVATMKLGRFNITPDVAPQGRLVTTGPYRWIRHPMYTSLLLTASALVADSPTPVRIVLLFCLLAILVRKLLFEERLLRAHYPDYANYTKRSSRLVPFLF